MNSVSEQSDSGSAAALAVDLAVAISRIRSRIREEAGETSRGITVSQLAMLRRLVDSGPMSASELAASEHVTQQAVAQRLALLTPFGYVQKTPDPTDKRRMLVEITAEGRALLDSLSTSGQNWLALAIQAVVQPAEIPDLRTAVELLDRLARADLRPDTPLR
jgi:DNA-binding MarR family transcriptional regulator